jgi:hypothetical protein
MGEYYNFKNEMYSASESDSNEFDNCDCLRTNPLFFTTDSCKKSLNQESFNEDQTSKRSSQDIESGHNWNDWSFSSSVNTLTTFSLISNQVINKRVTLVGSRAQSLIFYKICSR